MVEERIEVMKTWSKKKMIKDIQVFFSFTNSYQRFIKALNKITVPPTLILERISRSTITTVRKSDKACNSNIKKDSNDVFKRTKSENSDERVRATITKNSKNFLSSKAQAAFIFLRIAFINTLIFDYFDLECLFKFKLMLLDLRFMGY